MALNIRRILEGLRLVPKSSTTIDSQGEMEVLSSDGKIRYHNGTTASPMVTEAHSATLTNKTIDADSNTITNIENADIKSGAAIARNKLASGSANRVLVNDGSGVLSDAAAITASRALESDANGIPTHSAVTSTELGYVSGVTSGIQSQFSGKLSTTLADGTILIGNGSNVATSQTVSGDISLSNAGVAAISTGVIVDADVNASAAIARSKLGSGTASHVVINDGSGNFSSEATLAKSRGGSGQDNSSLTFPASGTLATTGGTETFTNKTLTTPQIDISTKATQSSTPSNPSSGNVKFYVKNDGFAYLLNSSGTETAIGSGQPANIQTVFIKDIKSSGTGGGDVTAGSYVTRVLNTLENPSSYSWVSLSSNQFTLSSGTYIIEASSPASDCDEYKTRLRNITDSTTVTFGTSERASSTNAATSRSHLSCVVTIAASKAFEVQIYVNTTVTTGDDRGLGRATNTGDDEVYTIVQVTKI